MANNIIIFSGSPGAGKSTILRKFSRMKNTIVVNMGTLMLEAGTKKGYVKHRDQIRQLTNKRLTELRNSAIKTINSMQGNILLDTHASVGINGRYLPGLPLAALDLFNHVSGLIYIDAVTEEIIERRKSDKTRKREDEDGPMIDNQRLINLSALTFASSYLNAPLFVVVNRKDQIKRSVKEIESRLAELLGD
jgi:adenylate kinase